MATAAFLGLPAHGHVNPTLPLVAELVRRGHAVSYFSTDEFSERIERSGARFVRYPAIRYDLSRPDGNVLNLAAGLAETGVALFPHVLEAVRASGARLVLHDSMAPWGSWAARLLGLPAVCSTSTFAIAPVMDRSLRGLAEVAATFFAACAQALAGADVQVLISAGHRLRPSDLGPLPPNVRVRPSVPQVDVLRRARLFVTHGGMNGVNEALCFGVPLLLFPQMAEQRFVARRVEALGAGRIPARSSLSPRGLRAAALSVLDDAACRERACWIGESLRDAGGASRAADLVEALVREGAARAGGTHTGR